MLEMQHHACLETEDSNKDKEIRVLTGSEESATKDVIIIEISPRNC